MQTDHIVIAAGIASAVAGAATSGAGFGRNSDLLIVGLSGVILGALVIVCQVLSNCVAKAARPAADAYSTGYQLGWANGVKEGRQIGRPTVIQFPDRRRGDLPIGSQL